MALHCAFSPDCANGPDDVACLSQENLANGHGRYMELPDQPAFFEATKRSKVKQHYAWMKMLLFCICIGAQYCALAPRLSLVESNIA